jgi:signal transduction histidine kinase
LVYKNLRIENKEYGVVYVQIVKDMDNEYDFLKVLFAFMAIADFLGIIASIVLGQNQFVADASHELRTPIAVIKGYANLLDRWGKDDREALEEIKNKTVKITVSDSGIGIPKEEIKSIFERFYTVDKSRSKEKGGTGLGLSIAKWIVDVHGGALNVESEEGKGTKIIIILNI